jgi:hypothetical protein
MRYFFAMTAPAAVALSMTLAAPAQAQTYPWCAEFSGRASNCGFASWQQCQATISGIGGWCSPNPYYTGEPTPRTRRR